MMPPDPLGVGPGLPSTDETLILEYSLCHHM
jgi:hypothetical protein